MSLKLGTQDIAGISQNKICNAHFLLEPIWSDHIINDISLLRADTFSWQSGGVYISAYNHLVQDIQGITAETETIGSYTVTFYRATDGHKIVLADMESTVADIYSETGIAWYYILDTVNTQFKLPRTKYGFEGLRGNVGDNINESLPNITGSIRDVFMGQNSATNSGAFYLSTQNVNRAAIATGSVGGYNVFDFDASRSSSTYQDDAPVQERATQMYLYFYVGDYAQTAIEQTAGLNAELFNNKVDLNFDNMNPSQAAKDTIIGWGMPDYSAGENKSWETSYYADVAGYVVVRGTGSSSSSCYAISISLNNSDWIEIGRVYTGGGGDASDIFPIEKGCYWKATAGGGGRTKLTFYPMKGAN